MVYQQRVVVKEENSLDINPEEPSFSSTHFNGGSSKQWLDREHAVWQLSQVHKVSNAKRGIKHLRQLDQTAVLTVDFHNNVRMVDFSSEEQVGLFKPKQENFKAKQGARQIHLFPEFDQDVLPYLMADDGQVFDVKMKQWVG